MAMNDDDRAFLDLFPANQRSTVANLFLRPVREGTTDAILVFAAVYAELRERIERPRSYAYDDSRDRFILDTLRANYDAATAYARWCVAYEQLSPEDKQRRKQASTAEGIGLWQEQQPPTDKQVAYLHTLGYTGPVESRRHASSLIEIYKRGGRVEVGGAL